MCVLHQRPWYNLIDTYHFTVSHVVIMLYTGTVFSKGFALRHIQEQYNYMVIAKVVIMHLL